MWRQCVGYLVVLGHVFVNITNENVWCAIACPLSTPNKANPYLLSKKKNNLGMSFIECTIALFLWTHNHYFSSSRRIIQNRIYFHFLFSLQTNNDAAAYSPLFATRLIAFSMLRVHLNLF